MKNDLKNSHIAERAGSVAEQIGDSSKMQGNFASLLDKVVGFSNRNYLKVLSGIAALNLVACEKQEEFKFVCNDRLVPYVPVVPEKKLPEYPGQKIRWPSTYDILAKQHLLRELSGERLGITGAINIKTLQLQGLYQEKNPNAPLALVLGSKGGLVATVQGILKQNLYFNQTISGNFDDATKKSVEIFQSDQQLAVTGIVDQITLAQLFRCYKDPQQNYYLSYIARDISVDFPSSGGGYCGQGVCNILKLHPDPRVRRIADLSARDEKGQRFYPEEKRHAVLIAAHLEWASKDPAARGWIKVPISKISDLKDGCTKTYPSTAGDFVMGTGYGSRTYGHIEQIIVVPRSADSPHERRGIYDLNAGFLAGTRYNFSVWMKHLAEGKSFMYIYVGDFLPLLSEKHQQQILARENRALDEATTKVETAQDSQHIAVVKKSR